MTQQWRKAGAPPAMKNAVDLESLGQETQPIVLAAGFFDGVHRGHQKVLARALAEARRLNGSAWVLTFEPHPAKVLSPERAPLLLTCPGHKRRLLRRCGIYGCLMLPFTRSLAAMPPGAFILSLLDTIPTLAEITVGHNWRFGLDGTGDTALATSLARRRGVRVTAVGPVRRAGAPISSTRIRADVAAGRLDEAANMLGRPFAVLGEVVPGHALGRQLGYPTANLDVSNEVMPPEGVYAVTALLGDSLLDGILSYGSRPTFKRDGLDRPSVELHLLDFDRDLYGEKIEVFFSARIRDQESFAGAAELIQAIRRDILATRRILTRKKTKESLYSHCEGVL